MGRRTWNPAFHKTTGGNRLPRIKVKGSGQECPLYTTLGCFLCVLKLGHLDGCFREAGGDS